jgi:predicted nucleic acid-binding protein
LIYLDSSVAIAFLLGENRQPPERLWLEPICSSRLLQYEIFNRLHARKLGDAYIDDARSFLDRILMAELNPSVLSSALEPFPVAVRTLDALHMATMNYFRSKGDELTLASYDNRLNDAARALDIPLYGF